MANYTMASWHTNVNPRPLPMHTRYVDCKTPEPTSRVNAKLILTNNS